MTLKRIFTKLLHEAEDNPGQSVGRTLDGGLRIEVTWSETRTQLRLIRAKVKPSETEFKTCLAAFPYLVDVPNRSEKRGPLYYRIATWPTPATLPMPLPSPLRLADEEAPVAPFLRSVSVETPTGGYANG